MFAVLSRPLARQTALRSVRCLSQSVPPQKPGPPPPPESSSSSNPTEQPPVQTAFPSLDISPVEPVEEKQRTGARSSKDSPSSIERRRRYLGRVSLAMLVLTFGVNSVYMGREYDEEELKFRKMKAEEAPATRWGRTTDRFKELFDYFNKPAWPELLPARLPPPHGKPYTLLVSLDDLLVTSTWDRQHGWRTAKRPGVDYFLAYISQFYEVVIFTTQYHYTAMPILEKLDKYNFFITHKLFRDATRSINGKIVKDLSYLNRDLSKVVLLDTHEDHISTHPENSILLPKWTGDPKDKGLVSMIPFLESLAIYKAPDVRPILEAYHGKDVPIEYAKKEAEAKQRHIEEWSKKSKGVSSSLTFSSMFGGPGSQSRSAVPLTYLEQKRLEAQQLYKEEQAYIMAHQEEFDKLLEQDQLAMNEGQPNSLWEMFGLMAGQTKPADPAASSSPPASPAPSSTASTSK
ncbi:NIF-domain-containing protein [Pleurotus eryngii]|uniref:Mitochondrial import inner membrane translocase subunit TIM50 n=1 Tax=Pleurotus eryngii TaxID=5323 RepID=A0A9P5ZY08_PLEER|nr:NIF-domain-containing protein [Pleurotus eryngii]